MTKSSYTGAGAPGSFSLSKCIHKSLSPEGKSSSQAKFHGIDVFTSNWGNRLLCQASMAAKASEKISSIDVGPEPRGEKGVGPEPWGEKGGSAVTCPGVDLYQDDRCGCFPRT